MASHGARAVLRRWCLGSALALAAAPFTGCGESPLTDPSQPLRLAINGDPLSLDPHLQNEFLTASVLGNLFEALTRFDPELRIQPSLASGWDNPDALTWRFHLRPGVAFHDGRPMEAEDVLFSLERARSHPASGVTAYLVGVASTRALDPETIEIVTDRPWAAILNKLAFVSIVPRGSPDQVTDPVGTGPYRLAEYLRGERLALEAFSGYWGDEPAEAVVELLLIPDDEERVTRLLAGEVDLVQMLPPREVSRVEAAPCCNLVATDSLVVQYLQMRTDRPPYSDRRVRQAIHLALDREGLVRDVVAGQGRPTAQLVTSDVVGYAPDLHPPERDLARARELLAEAGYAEGVELELEFVPGQRIDALQEQLAEAGIRLTPAPLPWEELYARLVAGEAVFHYGGVLAESGDASDVLDEIVHSRDPERGYGGANGVGYSNPEVDALIQASGSTLNPLRRRELLQECMRRVMADLSFIPLYVPYELYGVREGLEWTPRLDGTVAAAEIRRLPVEAGRR